MKKLADLAPLEFEHLIYDLLRHKDMRNLEWRTPGRDGGRDLEGYTFFEDISGHERRDHWFVECKRYTGTVDWPTVYGKLAYAANAGADVLLMATTSTFSPQCIDETQRHNGRAATPKIRLWGGHEIDLQIQNRLPLLVKYGLSEDSRVRLSSLIELAATTAKYARAAYSASLFSSSSTRAVETNAALSELFEFLVENITIVGAPTFNTVLHSYGWVDLASEAPECPAVLLRAMIAVYRSATRVDRIRISNQSESEFLLEGAPGSQLSDSQLKELGVVAFWGDAEISLATNGLKVRLRRSVE